MGIFDHLRTWQFETSASPEDCLDVFVRSLTKGGIQLLSSRWSVYQSTGPDGELHAVGSYQGRSGVVGIMSAMSTRSTSEQDAAIGSTIDFRVTTRGVAGGRAYATMAMTRTTKVLLFFTADARFFRSAMGRVGRAMTSLDPGLRMVKS